MAEALSQEAEGHPKVGALIRARRRQQHMTLMELGEAAQVSVGYLSQVERDHATPSLGTLAGIARALYVIAKEQRVVILRAFVKKTGKTPTSEIDLALKRAKEVKQ